MDAERVVFAAGSQGCAGQYHAPSPGRAAGSGVLVVSPWGWDEVASYRPRLRLAERLAAAGHPTLRYDLPGTGDSAGGPGEEGLAEAWVESVGAGVDWLRERGNVRIAVLGLGLGGLLAREWLARGGAIEELALWGAPPAGRSFARELKAFWRLQVGKAADDGEPLLPAGWIEVGGYVVSAETLASLAKQAPAVPADSDLRRALLLARDGAGADPALAGELRERGVEVAEDPGTGWGGMVDHPERSELPAETADHLLAWLGEGDGGDPPVTSPDAGPERVADPDPARLLVEAGGRQVAETGFTVEGGFGRIYGVLAEPASEPAAPVCAILLNAGAIQHTGPNRMWVEIARRGAAAGVPVLRLDLTGIGESDGDEFAMRDIAAFYRSNYEEEVAAVCDALEARGIAGAFLVSGLCAGAYWSARAALRDPRVRSAVMLNGGAITWHEELSERREANRFQRSFSLEWWRKLLRGSIRRPGPGELVGLVVARARRALRNLWARIARTERPSSPVIADLDRLDESGTRLVLAFSGGEGLAAELREDGILDRLGDWPSAVTCDLPGVDHTLRTIEAQRAAFSLFEAEFERLAKAGSRER